MKKTLITLLALAGVAAADTLTLNLSDLNSPSTLIGGKSNSAKETSAAFDNTTSFTTLTGLFTDSNKWYVSKGYNTEVNQDTTHGVPASSDGVILVAGGPQDKGRSAIGGIEFSLSASQLSQFDGPLTFSFNALHHYGNDNSNHEITFYLLTDAVTLSSPTYNTKTGANLLKETSQGTATPLTVLLTFTSEQVAVMQATGKDQTFAFVAYSNAVNGSNTGVLMNNFKLSGEMVPEPTTATLSLLALAGLAARRRRK